MKYMNKALTVLSAVALMAGFTACSSEEASVEQLNSEQVYFPNDVSTTIEVSAEASTAEFPIMRMGTDAASIPVTAEYGDDNTMSLSVPATINFSAGESKASLVLSYDPATVTPGHYDTVTLSFSDSYSTPYGASKVTLNVGQGEPWVSLGKCTVYEGFWDGVDLTCEIEQNELDPQQFRLVNPFNNGDYEQATELLPFRIYKAGETLLGETLTQDVVYWDYHDAALSYYSKYDDIIYMVFPGAFSSMATQDYWTYNKVLSYQDNGLPAQVQFAPMYYMFNNGGWNYTQYDEDFVITFPGVVIADYSADIAYSGKFEAADGTISAVGEVTLGADVASAKVTVVPGKDNVTDAYYGIEDGTLENVVSITESGEVKVAMPANAETGNYTMVVITYDADGTAQEYNYVTFKYKNAETPAASWDLTKPLVGTYSYVQFWEGDDEGLTLTPNGDGTFTISDWGYGVDFTFTLNDDNTLTFEDQFTGYTHSAYGDVYIRDLGLYEGEEVGTYSPEEGVFTFQTYYFVEAGYFGYGPETFTITGYAGDGARAKVAKTAKKSAKKVANHKTAKLPIQRSASKFGHTVYNSIPRNSKPVRF